MGYEAEPRNQYNKQTTDDAAQQASACQSKAGPHVQPVVRVATHSATEPVQADLKRAKPRARILASSRAELRRSHPPRSRAEQALR